MQASKQRPASSGPARQGDWPFLPPGTARQLLLLRWLALLLLVVLHWFDHSTDGVIFSLPRMAAVVIAYNALLLLLMRFVPWLRRPLNYLALDTVVATLSVALTGGYHSSFFVLYIFIAIGAAFYLELVPTVLVTLVIGLIYIGACYVNPAGLDLPYAQYIMAAKLLGLLVISVLCALLLEQLRREHRETERERALGRRLGELNNLFQKLNTTLDLADTLQTVAEAPAALLGAGPTAIALLDEEGSHLSIAAVVGMDLTLFADTRWTLDDPLIAAALRRGEPYVLDQPAAYLETLPPAARADPAVATLSQVIMVPLILNRATLGLLVVAYAREHPFADGDLAFLRGLAQEAALAIRNARLYQREREQVARLQALDRLQANFVSSVSHELQTPITCIRTSVDLLQATGAGLSADQADLLGTVSHHVGRLEGLVADLLQVTKLEARRVTLAPQPTDLRLLIDRVVDALRPLSEPKALAVRTGFPPVAGPVDVDRRRMEEVLTNLLENAIRFSPPGAAIDIQLAESEGQARVAITDRGPGIAPEHHDRIFDRFYTAGGAREHGGVGLGLFIAQQIIQLHGGRIWVESQPGAGSTFFFSVPITAPEETP
jgi:signal transduction histidine kinase